MCLFLFLLGWFCCFGGVCFIMCDWNGRSIIMTFLFGSMSLLFIGVVRIISSLVVLYSDDYIFGDLSIFRFNVCYVYNVFDC